MKDSQGQHLAAVGLGCRHGTRDVVCDVTVSLGEGELLGVLGPNGSGKTTLVRTLAGLHPPAHGRVTLDGTDLRAMPRRTIAKTLAMVPQREPLPTELTVRDVVALGRAPHTGWFGVLSRHDAEVIEASLLRCDVKDFGPRPFASLSGGEQKRVLIARALAQEARVILLDEPVAHLDIAHQLALCGLLATGTARRDFSAVVVLHDLNLAAQFCHRLLLLREGRVLALGTPDEVMTVETLRKCFDVDVYIGREVTAGGRFYVPVRVSEG